MCNISTTATSSVDPISKASRTFETPPPPRFQPPPVQASSKSHWPTPALMPLSPAAQFTLNRTEVFIVLQGNQIFQSTKQRRSLGRTVILFGCVCLTKQGLEAFKQFTVLSNSEGEPPPHKCGCKAVATKLVPTSTLATVSCLWVAKPLAIQKSKLRCCQ